MVWCNPAYFYDPQTPPTRKVAPLSQKDPPNARLCLSMIDFRGTNQPYNVWQVKNTHLNHSLSEWTYNE